MRIDNVKFLKGDGGLYIILCDRHQEFISNDDIKKLLKYLSPKKKRTNP